MKGAWGWIGAMLIILHFVFPFLLLLSRDLKRSTKWLIALSIFILAIRLLDHFYGIAAVPLIGHYEDKELPFQLNWMYFVAVIGVGGLWLWWFFRQLASRPLVPIKDPFLEKAIAHGHEH